MSCCKRIAPGDTIKVTDFRERLYGRKFTATKVEYAREACKALGLPYYGSYSTVVVTFRVGRGHETLATQYVKKVCEHV